MSALPAESLGMLASRARSLGRDAFIESIGGWVLVGPPPRGLGEEWSFRTSSLRTVKSGVGEDMVLLEERYVAYPLRKARPGPFADTVLIGRAASNDICLLDDSISKLHARIRRHDDGTYTLADAGSSNGTFINDTRLTAQERRAFQPGHLVTFGSVSLHVLTADALYDVLRSLLEG